MTNTIDVVTKVSLPEQRIRDLLTAGMEGGINYWCLIWDYKFSPNHKLADFQEKGRMQIPDNYHHPAQLIPFVPECAVIMVDANEVPFHAKKLPKHVVPWRLDREALLRGLQTMSEKFLTHWTRFINETEDAETGDVFIQLCLFGDIIYG